MEYTITKLAELAGISTRTLRYYDEIGLLKPKSINASGYRVYGKEEVDKLQQIMFYKELHIELKHIKNIVNDEEFDKIKALTKHKNKLYEKRKQIDMLIKNIEKTIAAHNGRENMNDNEKFEGFKQKMVNDNEEKYGKEVREKYGDETVDRSNKKLKDMTREQFDKAELLAKDIMITLGKAYKIGDPAGELAQKAAGMHKEWLCCYWDEYSAEAHANIADMYVSDERFKKYYDEAQPGTAEFLRDAILIYVKK